MSNKQPDLPDFENALEELETLVARLESGELNLDESLKQFKRGVELTRHCQGVLEQAQQVVEQLVDAPEAGAEAPGDRDD